MVLFFLNYLRFREQGKRERERAIGIFQSYPVVWKIWIAAEDRHETVLQQEMHVQEEERRLRNACLVEFAEREKKWSMEVDEEEDHQEPNSPASKKARTGHTPRVVLLLPNTTQHHCSLAVFSLVSGLQHLQHLLAQDLTSARNPPLHLQHLKGYKKRSSTNSRTKNLCW